MTDYRGNTIDRSDATARGPLLAINSVNTSTTVDAADITADNNFAKVLQSHVNVSEVKNSTTRYGNIQSKRKKQVDSETLSKRFGISPAKARRTVRMTTQRGIRTTLHPSLARRYPTNDRMLRYKRMPHPMFSDTLKAGTLSKRGNLYGQAYCTSFGWARCHPMAKKSEAHETLSLLFQRDVVPPKMIVDISKEQSLGNFARKCREADCHLVNTKPYSPW